MNRRDFRELIIKLIFQDIFESEIENSEYPEDALKVFFEVREVYADLDKIISENLVSWQISRLNYVDLAIVRYAVFEMKYKKLAPEIVINEALEITKKYSNLDDDSAKKFNNRLLDNIRHFLEKDNG
ncbi:MAG: transcription antitermination factor NusB [Candidatus Izemoplasmatales bacterium]|mgnify:CR=1 FL=1|jgi:N utilization substance protein B